MVTPSGSRMFGSLSARVMVYRYLLKPLHLGLILRYRRLLGVVVASSGISLPSLPLGH